MAAKFRAIDPHVSSTRTFDSDAPVPLARLVASRALPTIAIAMSTAVAFEDTPAWEAGLRVHEAENKWLLREFLAVLGASKSYARSLSGGGVDLGLGDGLGGVLGALAGAGAGTEIWPNISEKKDPPEDHEKFKNEQNKYEKYFKENL